MSVLWRSVKGYFKILRPTLQSRFRVLSLDGGVVRCCFVIGVERDASKLHGIPILEFFDFVIDTSTGKYFFFPQFYSKLGNACQLEPSPTLAKILLNRLYKYDEEDIVTGDDGGVNIPLDIKHGNIFLESLRLTRFLNYW